MKTIWATFLVTLLLTACSRPTNPTVNLDDTVGSVVAAFDIQNGQYFHYADGYMCQLKNNKKTLSYKDSIYFDGKQICQTGDLCNSKSNCKDVASVTDLHINNDHLQIVAFGKTYLYGQDLTQTGGKPDFKMERKIASIASSTGDGGNRPSTSMIMYMMWAIAFAATFYMQVPES